MKKKVLMLGNHEIVIYNFRKELIERMIKEGYEVYVSLPYGPKVKYLEEMGCKFIDTPINRRNTNPIEDIKLLLNYFKILEDVKPDVVLSYTVKPNVYGGIACRIKKIPYICNVTGLGSGYLNGGIVQKVVQLLSKISFRKANKIFFQNTADMNLLINQNIVKNNYDLLPGSGVNLKKYKVIPYPTEKEPINFNFVARVMKDKGIDEYLEAAKEVKRKYPYVVFNVIGMIDQPYYEDILIKYQKEGIIEYHGFQNDIIPFIKKCSCMVNPSYTEGMSNVLLENAACGRPLIASNIPGCKEIIDENINGYTFEVKNYKSLISKMEKFINLTYDKKVKLGLEGRKKVEKEFDREIVVNRYIKEINNI
ncbi:glycosyltransferase family 4 protein [Clostridium perfringens]|uniref:glycosyltransferase family 4 protein n=1 Tax=Clostridium perfringens TaxID=1502 RepID=UPI000E18C761|nr:glycosyltransferase family 4 protein [Clostridium perfringens]MDU6351450.1 glycosyltransferase family 4 protein [Clostridium perfringens]SUY38496.1 polysaccharide pyruvyl transferase CsaB [Clostridium perfringens]